MKNLINDKRAFLFLPFIALVFILIYSPSTSPLYVYEGFDSCTFKTIGIGILEGKIPYTDLFDHKGPILFWLNALGLLCGRVGLFSLEVIFFSAMLVCAYRIARLYTNESKAFAASLLTLIPTIDFITEGNQCEIYMLPFIALSLYMALRYTTGRMPSHPLIYSFFYGIAFAIIFFIRPNDAVSHVGAIMFGLFLLMLRKREYRNAIANATVFAVGSLVVAIPILIYFYSIGSLGDMLHGMIGYNLQYSSESGLNEGSIGILLIPVIIYGGTIFLSRRNDKDSWFILIPSLIFTLILIGKRDYYHYLLPILPVFCLFAAKCLSAGYTKVIAGISILFAIFSFRQHVLLVRCASQHGEIAELYRQSKDLILRVPESERTQIWNHNLYKLSSDKSPHVYSMTGIWSNAGVSPANRVFIPFHRNRFGEEATLAASKPKWLLYTEASTDQNYLDEQFLRDNYKVVATTADNCIAKVVLYQLIEND